MNFYKLYLKHQGVIQSDLEVDTLGQLNKILSKIGASIFASELHLIDDMKKSNIIDSYQWNYYQFLNRSNEIIFNSADFIDPETGEMNIEELDFQYQRLQRTFQEFEKRYNFIVSTDSNYLFNGKLEYNVFLSFERLSQMITNCKNGFSIEIENGELIAYSLGGNYDNGVPYLERYRIRCIDNSIEESDYADNYELYFTQAINPANKLLVKINASDYEPQISM